MSRTEIRTQAAISILSGMMANGFMPDCVSVKHRGTKADGTCGKWNYPGAAVELADLLLNELEKEP